MRCHECASEFTLAEALEDDVMASPDFVGCPVCGRAVSVDPDFADDSHDDEVYE